MEEKSTYTKTKKLSNGVTLTINGIPSIENCQRFLKILLDLKKK